MSKVEETGTGLIVPISKLEKTIKKIDADKVLIHTGNILKYVNTDNILKQVEGRAEFEEVTLVYGSDAKIGEYITKTFQDKKLTVSN